MVMVKKNGQIEVGMKDNIKKDVKQVKVNINGVMDLSIKDHF